jgi:hypothetical protein
LQTKFFDLKRGPDNMKFKETDMNDTREENIGELLMAMKRA